MTLRSNERVTMRMLAEMLGVTKTTISLALRDHPSISKETRARVVKLAREMNYRPDPAIAAIAAQRWSCGSPERHRVIAFLINGTPDRMGLQAEYLPGAKQRAEELGYKLEPFYLENYPTAEAVNRVLYARGIRGIVIPPILNPESKRAMHLEWEKFTAVCCGVGRVRPPLHTVTSDHFMTTRLVWEVAAKAGYNRIGATLYFHDPVADDDWQRMGASSAAIQFLKMKEAASIPFLTTRIHDKDALLQWYHEYKPELIIGFNYLTGELLENNGVRLGKDVQFVCLFAPPDSRWSGITHHYAQVGRTSVDLLNAELRDNRWGLPEFPNIIQIQPEWNQGNTFSHDELGARFTFQSNRSLSPPVPTTAAASAV